MVRNIYNRSLSFPVPNPNRAGPKIKGRGSTSLPVRFHPLISPIQDHIQSLLTWQSQPGRPTPAHILTGLAHLARLHSALDDLLQHPKAQDQLRRRATWTDRALDDFLNFADAYGSLRSAIADLRDRISATQVAMWRNDSARIAAALREQRRAEKEVARIAAAVRGGTTRWGTMEGEEVGAAVREVAVATAVGTGEVFGGVAVAAAAAVDKGRKGCLGVRMGRKGEGEEEEWRREAVERLEEAAEMVAEVEKGCERLLRCLLNSRVLLLNVLTPNVRG